MRKSVFSNMEIAEAVMSGPSARGALVMRGGREVPSSTLYDWRRRYSGMDASAVGLMRFREGEILSLRRALGASKRALDGLREFFLPESEPTVETRRACVEFLKAKHGFSECRSWFKRGIARSVPCHEPADDPYVEVRPVPREVAAPYPEYAHRRLHAELGKLGYDPNHKTVARLRREEGLTLPRRKPKRFRKSEKRIRPSSSNLRWSIDFMSATPRTRAGGPVVSAH